MTQWNRPSKESEIIAADPRREIPIRLSGEIVLATGHLLATAKEVISQSQAPAKLRPKLLEIIARGSLINLQIQDWDAQASGKFKYVIMKPAEILASEDGFFPGLSVPIHLYSSRTMAHLWNTHRCARKLLLQCLRKCVALIGDSPSTTILEPEHTSNIHANVMAPETIQDLISDICASVPYSLGEVDRHGNLQQFQSNWPVGAFFLIWPLRVALNQGCARDDQKAWIIRQLEHIRNVYGIQGATNGVQMPS